jgi:hypothetical protein
MSDTTTKFYGKYRGMVVNNIDPMQWGAMVKCPTCRPIPSSWAMLASPSR